MGETYALKVAAAEFVLLYGFSRDWHDMERAEDSLARSLMKYRELAALAGKSYHFANSMQTSQRKIPFPGGISGARTNYLWSQLVPLYQKELDDFHARVAALKQSGGEPAPANSAPIAPLPPASFHLLSTNAETYEVKTGAKPFKDRNYTIYQLAPELNGLVGIRIAHDAAKSGHYEPIEFEVSE